MQPNENQNLTKYYEDLLDLFTRPGWKILVGEMEEEIERLKTSIFDKNKDSFDLDKGTYKTLQRFVNLPLLVEQGYESLQEWEELNAPV